MIITPRYTTVGPTYHSLKTYLMYKTTLLCSRRTRIPRPKTSIFA